MKLYPESLYSLINFDMALLQFHSSPFLCVFIVCLIVLAHLSCVCCLNFNYSSSSSPLYVYDHFLFFGSATMSEATLKITLDSQREELMKNTAGRVMFKDPLTLWSNKSSKIASFNTSFVMSIQPVINSSLGEGLAFIVTSTPSLPPNSSGKGIGMGSDIDASAKFVAVVFYTSWKVGEGNRVEIATNSIDRSVSHVDLSEYCMNISDASNYSVSIRYNGVSKDLTVDVHNVNGSRCGSSEPVIPPLDLDLSKHLTEDVYVGFSASTSEFYELNYIYSWSFVGDATSNTSGTANLRKLLRILLPLALVLLLAFGIASIVFFKIIRRRGTRNYGRRGGNSNVESALVSSTKGPVKFRFKQLKSATTNFDPRHKLGQGGFGEVYKGFLKESQEQVAVKRVSRDSKQGVQEFVSEITTIGKLSHKNLARLIGWCCEKNELLLVYEFLSNGSLDKHLFSQDKTMVPLSWERRHKIITGVASALYYLHDGCPKRVLHRDVKPSNVMLDKDYNARLGDFGLARTIQQEGHTHHTTHVLAGTPGYIAPEYCITGQASAESDVYAFGALALEVATGRRPAGGRRRNPYDNHVIDWVWELYGRQRLVEAGDPNMEVEFDPSQLEILLRLGIACCHPSSAERPTMRMALQVLSGEVPPPEPPREKPSFTWPALPVDVDHVEGDESSTIGGQLTQSADFSGR